MLRLGARALCDRITPTRNYGLKALLCMHSTFPKTMHVPEIKWTRAEPLKMNAMVERVEICY